MTDISQRLEDVRARIRAAAAAAGRSPKTVKLLAVSKKKPASQVRAAYAAGQRDFGENYVQELAEKADELADLPDLRWHFIGHLQRNKVKTVVRYARIVHTVDSVRLTQELAKRGPSGETALHALVEVNVGGEAQKSGVEPAALAEVLDSVEAADNLTLCGLMTVPPLTDSPGDARKYFDALAELRDRFGGSQRLPELSMGMTADLEHAVLAGATWVRIGTAIFGPRRNPDEAATKP